MTRRAVRTTAVAVLATVAVAGCSTTVEGTGTRVGSAPSATDFPSTSSGGSSPTDSPTGSPTSSPTGGDASDLVDQMVEAMTTRPQGFTMRGKFDADGDVANIDLRMATDSGQGSITIGDAECDLVNDAGEGYAKAPATFWSDDIGLDDDVASQIDGKWVTMSGDLEVMKTFVDAETFLGALTSTGDFTLGDTTTKQGVDVQTVDGDDGTTFYISADEPHVLVELDDEDGPLAFGFPDDGLTVTPPSGAIPYPG